MASYSENIELACPGKEIHFYRVGLLEPDLNLLFLIKEGFDFVA